ncbi:hypothetical protein [Desulfobulbus elongatus]|uniref:hypothetical protein n=1 Tax=Desulfobulbus elongatus TaxID=53332 RepID=UPI00047FE9FC|nr:hypothetical protein [Desulfobulbus elongatus]
MNSNAEKQMQDQLRDIGATMESVRANVPRVKRTMGLEDHLYRVWDASQELQRALELPGVISGYRADAVDQVLRIIQLMDECDAAPDTRQLISIGYACELARDKIRAYLALDRAAVNKSINQGDEE